MATSFTNIIPLPISSDLQTHIRLSIHNLMIVEARKTVTVECDCPESPDLHPGSVRRRRAALLGASGETTLPGAVPGPICDINFYATTTFELPKHIGALCYWTQERLQKHALIARSPWKCCQRSSRTAVRAQERAWKSQPTLCHQQLE